MTHAITITTLGRRDPEGPVEVRITTDAPRDLRQLRKAIRAEGHWVQTEGEPYSLRCTIHAARAVGLEAWY